MGPDKQSQLPGPSDEFFNIITASSCNPGARLGRLTLQGKKSIDTPHYLAITSRGAVPHLTPDNLASSTSISGVYVGLEDFIERAPCQSPPLYEFQSSGASSSLRRFIALPEDALLVLGARRTPPVTAPAANPNTEITVSVSTAVGFRSLSADGYARAVERLEVDIVVGLGDIPYGRALGAKRIVRATDRSIQWMQDHVDLRKKTTASKSSAKLFAPLLPLSCANQQFYIDCLSHDIAHDLSGLAIHDVSTLEDLPNSLSQLPRLGLTAPRTPHEVLHQIANGLDILTLPFIAAATDAGIALDFSLPPLAPSVNTQGAPCPLPLGIDMWLPTYAVDLSPLVEGCACYACTDHHKAYMQHLLVAKEMLGWVLLQIHNHCIIDRFFSGIRRSITDGTFEEDVGLFGRAYDSGLPEKTGQGPRIRGYQFRSEGPGEDKRNKAPFVTLNAAEENSGRW